MPPFVTDAQIFSTNGETIYGIYIGGNEDIVTFDVDGEVHEIPIVDIISITFEPLQVVDEWKKPIERLYNIKHGSNKMTFL